MVADVLFPLRCAGCGVTGASPCPACWETFRRPLHVPVPPPFDALFAPLSYEGAARELVARLKYRNHRGALPWLAEAMAAQVPEGLAAGCVVTWAPTTDARRRERGFDHAELLARRVAFTLGQPAARLLRRRAGHPQTGLAPAERRANRPVFAAVRTPPERVVLVDDVVTTGTTMAAAAEVLREAGATAVVGLAAAFTPLKGLSD